MLSIRGTASVERVDGVVPEYAAAARRYFGEDQGKAWVERAANARWLKDGSFLWPSERTGWQHLYRYRADGTLVGPVTSR